MKISIMFLTYKRQEMAKRVLEQNLNNTGFDDYELLICDQGTMDESWYEYLMTLKTSYIRLNELNEGVARGLNQLMIRAKGEHVVFMPNDILLPQDWLKSIVEHIEEIPNTGIVGFEGQDYALPDFEITGVSGKKMIIGRDAQMRWDYMCVYGVVCITRTYIDNVGYFDEMYHPYGFEDADLCYRCFYSGLFCYYIKGMRAEHIGIDHTGIEDYRHAKDNFLYSNAAYHKWKSKNYLLTGIYCPPPRLRQRMN